MFCIANLAATMRIPTWNSTVGLHVISELEQPNLLRSQGSPCCCSSHHPITSPFGPCRQYSSWTHSYLRFGISMIYIYIHILKWWHVQLVVKAHAWNPCTCGPTMKTTACWHHGFITEELRIRKMHHHAYMYAAPPLLHTSASKLWRIWKGVPMSKWLYSSNEAMSGNLCR